MLLRLFFYLCTAIRMSHGSLQLNLFLSVIFPVNLVLVSMLLARQLLSVCVGLKIDELKCFNAKPQSGFNKIFSKFAKQQQITPLMLPICYFSALKLSEKCVCGYKFFAINIIIYNNIFSVQNWPIKIKSTFFNFR